MWKSLRHIRQLEHRHSALTLRSFDTTATMGSRTSSSFTSTFPKSYCGGRNEMFTGKGQKRQVIRLLMLYLLPVCIYLIFSLNELAGSITDYKTHADNLGIVKEGLDSVRIIQYLQMERATSVKCLYSKSNTSNEQLSYVYNNTDNVVRLVIPQHHRLIELLETDVKHIRDTVMVNNTNVSALDIAEQYSGLIDLYIDIVFKDLSVKIHENVWTTIASHEFFTVLQEQLAIERDIASSILAGGEHDQTDEYLLYIEKVFQGDEAFGMAQALATDIQLNYSYHDVLQNVQSMRQEEISLTNNSSSLILDYWFENMTYLIHSLGALQNSIGAILTHEISVQTTKTEISIVLIGSLICFNVLATPLIVRIVYMAVKKLQHFLIRLKEKSRELGREKRRSDRLINTMLPKAVSEELKRTGFVQAETFDECTIYFSDIVGFTTICSTLSPMEVVAMLNGLYSLFDSRIGIYDCYKVETIGDAYMVVSGVPVRNGNNHVGEISSLALDLHTQISQLSVPHKPTEKMKMRIGLHTGPCVAGVVGTTMPRYCLFGVTVSIAAKMESHGQAGRIHISESTFNKLKEVGGYEAQERGIIRVKDTGQMKTYWLLGKTSLLKPSSHLTVEFPL